MINRRQIYALHCQHFSQVVDTATGETSWGAQCPARVSLEFAGAMSGVMRVITEAAAVAGGWTLLGVDTFCPEHAP